MSLTTFGLVLAVWFALAIVAALVWHRAARQRPAPPTMPQPGPADGRSLPAVNESGEITGFVYHLPGETPPVPAAALSGERLEEIRRTVPEAYRPPWHWQPTYDMDGWEIRYPADHPQAGLVATLPGYGENLAFFIAEARSAVPELLGEISRLYAQVAELEQAAPFPEWAVQLTDDSLFEGDVHPIRSCAEIALRRARREGHDEAVLVIRRVSAWTNDEGGDAR